jgi:hypothetical protein
MKTYTLSLIVALLLWGVPAASAQEPKAAEPTAPAAGPALELTAADLDALANAERFLSDAARDRREAELTTSRAELVLLATKYRILALRRLSPEQFAVELRGERGPDGRERAVWRIVPIPASAAAEGGK